MTLEEVQATLRGSEPKALAPIVRRALDDETAVPTNWKVNPLAVESVGQGTVGFLRVSGTATATGEEKSWSSVVKIVGSTAIQADPFNTPEREIEFFASPLANFESDGFKVVPCHAITHQEDQTLLWLEDLSDAAKYPWNESQFLSAATHLGIFNGGWPESRLDPFGWLDRSFETNRLITAQVAGRYDVLLSVRHSDESKRIANDLQVDPEKIYSGLERIAERSKQLPRVLCHNDSHSRNLFLMSGPVDSLTTYGADWASVGIGPVGVDAGNLAGGALIWGEQEALVMRQIEADLFERYFTALEDQRFEASRNEVRLGHLSALIVYIAFLVRAALEQPANGFAYQVFKRRFGVAESNMQQQFARRLSWFMPLFDEAIELAS